MNADDVDPITAEIVVSGLAYASEEMGIAVRNAAYSPNIKERLDHLVRDFRRVRAGSWRRPNTSRCISARCRGVCGARSRTSPPRVPCCSRAISGSSTIRTCPERISTTSPSSGRSSSPVRSSATPSTRRTTPTSAERCRVRCRRTRAISSPRVSSCRRCALMRDDLALRETVELFLANSRTPRDARRRPARATRRQRDGRTPRARTDRTLRRAHRRRRARPSRIDDGERRMRAALRAFPDGVAEVERRAGRRSRRAVDRVAAAPREARRSRCGSITAAPRRSCRCRSTPSTA